MHDFLNKEVRISSAATATGANGPVVFTSTGDKWIISPAVPIVIQRWGIILNVAKDASALVATLALRPTAGSDTARAVQDTMTDTATARAAGVLLQRRIVGTNPNQTTGSDGSIVNTGVFGSAIAAPPLEGIVILPGQEAVFAVTTAAASTGQGYLFSEYVVLPQVPQFNTLQSTTLNYTIISL